MGHHFEIADIVFNILSNERVRLTLQAYINDNNREETIETIKNFVISFKQTEGRFPTVHDFLEECYAYSCLYT